MRLKEGARAKRGKGLTIKGSGQDVARGETLSASKIESLSEL
jgi:hypothetical protein